MKEAIFETVSDANSGYVCMKLDIVTATREYIFQVEKSNVFWKLLGIGLILTNTLALVKIFFYS